MAIATEIGKKLVMRYEKGSYSFDKIDMAANKEKIYELAGILNSFQAERPPKKVILVTTSRIM